MGNDLTSNLFTHVTMPPDTTVHPSDVQARLGDTPLPANAALKAIHITPHDTVIETQTGARLPGVPLSEARALNSSPERTPSPRKPGNTNIDLPPSSTDPLFPPLPVYGPPSTLRNLQCLVFRIVSGVLSVCFLLVIVLGTVFAELIPTMCRRLWERLRGRDPDRDRPLLAEEKAEAKKRRGGDAEAGQAAPQEPAKLMDDIGYYARRVGLDAETHTVETEDGFLLEMNHIFDPADPPGYMLDATDERPRKRRYPLLLLHGLLQSAGAYCVNDDRSLAFYLTKCGYDVFLGNNRCGFRPAHTSLTPSDPRMWAWNIRQMGILDLPAFIHTILSLTSFSRLGLIAHSQGTTLTFLALAKQQLPSLGEKISIFCALAPAVYAGSLIDRFYFKFMRIISPRAFRLVFGIHAFIPVMMFMQRHVPRRFYGALGYRVFAFLFGWTDRRWDRGLRDRFFLFAPVYLSAEAMRWWLGKECFARHRCVLATKGDHDEAGEWFDERFPKLALWVAKEDKLVDGVRLLKRLEERERVRVVHAKVLEGYAHLDVVWAMDAEEQIFREMRTIIWRELEEDEKVGVVVPEGCEELELEEKKDAMTPEGCEKLEMEEKKDAMMPGASCEEL